jgi:SAM-dependent methyltransferase
MIPPLVKALGLSCYYTDRVADLFLGERQAPSPDALRDRTGRVVTEARPLEVSRPAPDTLLIHYPKQLAHSLWRSQELSLFHRKLLARPLVDFGCGDGSFAKAFCGRVDYGLDIDPVALSTARGYGIYDRLICCRGSALPLPSKCVTSIFSNSVLEHVDEVMDVVRELRRILVPQGTLVFTVPVFAFAEHLAKYFGEKESQRLNRCYFHKNLHAPEWWEDLLECCGFRVTERKAYQPDWFSFVYRVLSTRVFSVLQRIDPVEQVLRRQAARMVEASTNQTIEGGNIFLVAIAG